MIQKKIHRFLVPNIPEEDTFTLTDKRLVHQLFNVLKMKIGESLVIFQNEGPDIEVKINEITKSSIYLQKISTTNPTTASKYLIAAISITKGQTFELIVQKLTELGVREIVPIITSRTIKQSLRLDRLQTISDEALEQSGNNTRVLIHEPMRLRDCIEKFPISSIAFQQNAPNKTKLADNEIIFYVGPEGGWSEEDLELLKNVSWQSLGTRVLRAETAAIVGAYELLK